MRKYWGNKLVAKYVAAGVGIAALGAASAGTVALSAQQNTKTVERSTAPKPDPKPPPRGAGPNAGHGGYGGPGSPPVGPYPPAVSVAAVVAYMAWEDVTSCTYVQDPDEANYLASSHGFELPSSSPLWEAFTCVSATASYFVVYEQFGSRWSPTNTVQTS